jgi:hypothetical protein
LLDFTRGTNGVGGMVQFTNFIYSIVNTVAPFMTGTVAIYIVAFSLVVFIYDIFFGDGSIFE